MQAKWLTRRGLPLRASVRRKRSSFALSRCVAEVLEQRLLLSASLVKDINVGANGSVPNSLVNVGGTLFFSADDGTGHGNELWKSDGTEGGTVLVDPTGAGPTDVSNLTNLNGTLFFTARDGSHGNELWKSNGTAVGTVMVSDINPGAGDSNPSNLATAGNFLLFAANDGSHGNELWQTNGTTTTLFDINPGAGSSNPSNMTKVGGNAFFWADDGTRGIQLWRTDGTTFAFVSQINPTGNAGPTSIVNFNGTAIFAANDGTTGFELWKSTGTGATRIADINPGIDPNSGNPLSSFPVQFTVSNGFVYFRAQTAAAGQEFWVTDGTTAQIVLDINPGPTDSHPVFLTNLNGKVFFQADDGVHGPELAVYNTAANSLNIVDINPGANGSAPFQIATSNGLAYFAADDGTHGQEIWQSDGTTAGTVLTQDINPSGDSFPSDFTDVNGTLFFAANDGTHGIELWKVGGASAVKSTIQTVEAQQFSGPVSSFTATPGKQPSNFTATIDWGDGSNSAGTITQSGGVFLVSGSHTYGEEGNHPVVATVHDIAANNDLRGVVDISRLPESQSEPTIAIDPTNPNRIFAASNQSTAGLFAAVSSDGGATWITRVIANGGDSLQLAASDPQVKFDRFGNLFLTYLSHDAKTVIIAVSTDDGQNFQTVGKVVSAVDTGGVDQPSIAVGPGTGGQGDTVWVSYKSGDSRITVAGATVSGLGAVSPFSTPQETPGSLAGSFGDISVGPLGQVVVVWQNNLGSNGSSTISANVDADGLGPSPFSNDFAVSSTNVGGMTAVPADPMRTFDAEANLAWDLSNGPHRGRLYMSYTDAAGPGSNDTNIFVRSSDDAGQTWSAPVRVNDDTGINSQFLPSIAVDQTNGDVGLMWYDARNDPQNVLTQTFISISSDGGATFTPNQQVSSSATNTTAGVDAFGLANDRGDYSYAAFFGGSFHPVWADSATNIAGNPDVPNLEIVTATVPVAQVADAPLSATAAPAFTSFEHGQFTHVVGNFTDANPNATPDDYTATIDWGDGQTSPGTVGANGDVAGTHNYATSGMKQVTLRVADHGATASATTTNNVIATPLAQLSAPIVNLPDQATETLTVTYTDDFGVKASTIGSGNLLVTAPNGTTIPVVSASVDLATDGSPRVGAYVINAPSGTWLPADDGTYSVSIGDSQVSNVQGNFIPPGPIGSFVVDILEPKGSFGVVNGKKAKLTFTTAGGVPVTLSLTSGTGHAFEDPATGKINLTLDGTSAASAVIVKSKGGPITLGSVQVNGSLKSLTATNINLSGNLVVVGNIGKLALGNVSGTLAASGSIASLAALSLNNANILSGVSLGSDGAPGGSGSAADTFTSGFIGSFKIAGRIVTSTIAAGIAPGPDGIFGNADDNTAGDGSVIKTIFVRGGLDDASTFEADAFSKTAKVPRPVNTAGDAKHFRVI